MALTEMQGMIWKQIAQVYDQWDPDWQRLMPVRELSEKLPTVDSALIGETLAQAASDHLAEVGHVGEDPTFRPLEGRVTGSSEAASRGGHETKH